MWGKPRVCRGNIKSSGMYWESGGDIKVCMRGKMCKQNLGEGENW